MNVKPENPNIETEELSVTIKALKVNSRRMTLSVFKQLPERSVIGKDLTPKGKVWGKVKYPSSGKSDNHPYPYIVWQDGDELCRCVVKMVNITPENAKRSQLRSYDDSVPVLPHSVLINAVEGTSLEEIGSLSELFDRYNDLCSQLEKTDQLFIAT